MSWRIALITVLFCPASGALAQLKWEQPRLELRPPADQVEITAEFAFTNAGNYAVTLKGVDFDCDCTQVKSDKTTYQPGEKGKVAIKFAFGQRVGVQDKAISVTTDDRKSDAQLRLIVHIPELVEITPRMVYWEQGDRAEPKSMKLRIAEGVKMKILRVEAAGDKMKAELRADADGRGYELIVTPADTAASGTTVLTLHTDFPADHPRNFQAYAKVLPDVK